MANASFRVEVKCSHSTNIEVLSFTPRHGEVKIASWIKGQSATSLVTAYWPLAEARIMYRKAKQAAKKQPIGMSFQNGCEPLARLKAACELPD